MEKLTIYAHGISLNKNGGWGVITISEVMREGAMTNIINEQSGCQAGAAAKTMELQAAISALTGLNEAQIIFFTTSKYVLQGVKALDKPKKMDEQMWNVLRGLVANQKIEWKATGQLPASQQRVEQLARQGSASVINNEEDEEEDAA